MDQIHAVITDSKVSKEILSTAHKNNISIIKNKITAKDYILYDYNSKSFNNPFGNLPTTPEFNPLPNLNN